MIIGLGNDIANIDRIEKTLQKFGDRFIKRVFSAYETKEAEYRSKASHKIRAGSYAKRFAAKEACSKALGTGLRKGVFWKDMEVKHHKSGKPSLVLHNGAKKRLLEITPNGYIPKIDVTLTDDHPFAMAVVIISAVTKQEAELLTSQNIVAY